MILKVVSSNLKMSTVIRWKINVSGSECGHRQDGYIVEHMFDSDTFWTCI